MTAKNANINSNFKNNALKNLFNADDNLNESIFS